MAHKDDSSASHSNDKNLKFLNRNRKFFTAEDVPTAVWDSIYDSGSDSEFSDGN